MTKAMLRSKSTANTAEDVQVIHDANGAPAFAVVPWADFQALKNAADEDAVLIAAGEAARGEYGFPAAVAKRLVAGENFVKVLREWRKLTQGELGSMVETSPVYISQIERGARDAGRKLREKLAVAFNVPAEALADL